MILDFFNPNKIINEEIKIKINIPINENFYLNCRFKVVKFTNFETPSPNFAAPSLRINYELINLKIQYDFRFLYQ
jgi:hypothetical protein